MAPEEARFYLKECHELIRRMKARGADWSENLSFVKRAAALAMAGDYAAAKSYFSARVAALMESYWPECQHPAYLKAKV
jgi:hypothetical protein